MCSYKKIELQDDLCGYCGLCVNVCPKWALNLNGLYLNLDYELCDGCGVCIKVCPLGALKQAEGYTREEGSFE